MISYNYSSIYKSSNDSVKLSLEGISSSEEVTWSGKGSRFLLSLRTVNRSTQQIPCATLLTHVRHNHVAHAVSIILSLVDNEPNDSPLYLNQSEWKYNNLLEQRLTRQ